MPIKKKLLGIGVVFFSLWGFHLHLHAYTFSIFGILNFSPQYCDRYYALLIFLDLVLLQERIRLIFTEQAHVSIFQSNRSIRIVQYSILQNRRAIRSALSQSKRCWNARDLPVSIATTQPNGSRAFSGIFNANTQIPARLPRKSVLSAENRTKLTKICVDMKKDAGNPSTLSARYVPTLAAILTYYRTMFVTCTRRNITKFANCAVIGTKVSGTGRHIPVGNFMIALAVPFGPTQNVAWRVTNKRNTIWIPGIREKMPTQVLAALTAFSGLLRDKGWLTTWKRNTRNYGRHYNILKWMIFWEELWSQLYDDKHILTKK